MTPQFIDDNRAPGEWLSAANALAERVLQTDAKTAYDLIREGRYEGTPFAAELSQLMFLAGEDEPIPRAAE